MNYWQKVKHDQFTYHLWYQNVYNELKDGDIFIEIGTWTGASSLFFGELIQRGKKKIDFYTIDTFLGSEELLVEFRELLEDDKLYKYYMQVREPLKDYIKVIRGDSQSKETSNLFEDESVAGIFIDGDHTKEGFRRDIKNWWPKIKQGGIFSGHDYIWGGKGVKPIIDNFSTFKAKRFLGDVWYYNK